MADLGYAGMWTPLVISDEAFENLANLVGQPPYEGGRWVMVNLFTREVKWYKRSRKRPYYNSNGRRNGGKR